MSVIAFIDDYAVIKKILGSLENMRSPSGLSPTKASDDSHEYELAS